MRTPNSPSPAFGKIKNQLFNGISFKQAKISQKDINLSMSSGDNESNSSFIPRQ